MDIQVCWKGVGKSEEVEDHVFERVGFALDRIAPRIRRVVVRFEDLNGPRGGVDKSCRVEISGDFGSRSAEARDVDFRIAADRALKIVSRSTMRILRRPIGLRNDPVDAPNHSDEVRTDPET